MSKRLCRLEFVRAGGDLLSDDPGDKAVIYRTHWYWRFIAANGKETARSSETYRNRVDAIRSAELTTGCYNVREWEVKGEEWGECLRLRPEPGGYVDAPIVESVRVLWLR